MSSKVTQTGRIFTVFLVFTSAGRATVREVPDPYPSIQAGIDAANDGDTISVWGDGEPPFTYNEHINYGTVNGVAIINRSFIPGETPGYDSSWDHVIIDGQGQDGPVVYISCNWGQESCILKGFAIRNGNARPGPVRAGGGVCVNFANARILSNKIEQNRAIMGGGIFVTGSINRYAVLADNLVQGNISDREGGGLLLHDVGLDSITVRGNTFDSNEAGAAGSESRLGGGLYIRYGDGLPYLPYESRVFKDNTITNNTILGGTVPCGGGMAALGWPYGARGNVVMGNTPDGVYDTYWAGGAAYHEAMNLGTTEDPGYNVLMANGDRDLTIIPRPESVPRAEGNYWGTLNSLTIRDRMCYPSSPDFHPAVVAASGKWFEVDVPSLCKTGVIVTGDLPVVAPLQIPGPPYGSTIEFLPHSDFTSPLGDPARCGLYVSGEDGSLTAIGTAEQPIVFKSRPDQGPEQRGDWYGISAMGLGSVELDHCDVRSAYTGVRADDASLTVCNSSIHDNQYCGILTHDAEVQIADDTIFGNEVYGIRCEALRPGTEISANCLEANGIGISCADYEEQANIAVADNRIVGSEAVTPLNLYGIELQDIGVSLCLSENVVTGYPQAGILQDGSSASMALNKIIGVGYDGLRCLGQSRPQVRSTTIDTCANGVFVDESSLPDLGTGESHGDNSILLGNAYYVYSLSAAQVAAEYNWWGADPPVAQKFIGGVDYDPWLTEPPEDEGGGEQSKAVSVLPAKLDLLSPRPSPCHEATVIAYSLSRPGRAVLSLYDISGRRLNLLANGKQCAGSHLLNLNVARLGLAPGIYVLRLEAEGKNLSRRLIVQ